MNPSWTQLMVGVRSRVARELGARPYYRILCRSSSSRRRRNVEKRESGPGSCWSKGIRDRSLSRISWREELVVKLLDEILCRSSSSRRRRNVEKRESGPGSCCSKGIRDLPTTLLSYSTTTREASAGSVGGRSWSSSSSMNDSCG